MIETLPVSFSLFPFPSLMWLQPLFLTLQLMIVSVVIASIVGIAAAWAASTLESSGRIGRMTCGLFLACMVAAVAMPMILHAAAWEATAGKFGWLPLTQTGSRFSGSRASGLTSFGAFGGLIACGWIHGLVGAAMVTLATWHGVRIAAAEVIDQARLDLTPNQIWWRVRLPMAMPWLVTALLGTAALAATEMTVVDLYGFRTIADEFYLMFAVNPTSMSLVMTCVLPMVIGATLLAVVTSSRRERIAVRRRENRNSLPTSCPHRGTSWAAMVIVVATTCLILCIPLAGLFVKTGHHIVVTDDHVDVRWSLQTAGLTLINSLSTFASEYQWTAILASLTGVASLAIAWPLAALGRSIETVRRAADGISIIMFLIPGPIVGLSVVKFFQLGIWKFDVLHQQTLIPTMTALLFRAAPLAYWVLRSGYRVMDQSLIDAAQLDGGRVRRMWSIDRPMLGTSFFVALSGAALMASGDVPVTLPVIPPGVTTVGTRLFGLLHSGARQQEAGLAIWYVATVVMVVFGGLMAVGRQRS